VYTVQLQNPNQVPAEWSIKRPAVDSPKLRDWPFFAAEPAEGVLEPGARANIRVTFTPQASGRRPRPPLPRRTAATSTGLAFLAAPQRLLMQLFSRLNSSAEGPFTAMLLAL
jgi:hypothetical protein